MNYRFCLFLLLPTDILDRFLVNLEANKEREKEGFGETKERRGGRRKDRIRWPLRVWREEEEATIIGKCQRERDRNYERFFVWGAGLGSLSFNFVFYFIFSFFSLPVCLCISSFEIDNSLMVGKEINLFYN